MNVELIAFDVQKPLSAIDAQLICDGACAAEVFLRTSDRTRRFVEALQGQADVTLNADETFVEVSFPEVLEDQLAPLLLSVARSNQLTLYDLYMQIVYNAEVSAPNHAMVESPWLLADSPADRLLLESLVECLAREEDDPFCIVNIGDAFMQTIHDEDAPLNQPMLIEHKLEGAQHMHVPDALSTAAVSSALWSFACGTTDWQALPWAPLEL